MGCLSFLSCLTKVYVERSLDEDEQAVDGNIFAKLKIKKIKLSFLGKESLTKILKVRRGLAKEKQSKF